MECVICLDDIFSEGASCVPCGHVYHTKCIKPWLKSKKTCPLCSKVFSKANLTKLFLCNGESSKNDIKEEESSDDEAAPSVQPTTAPATSTNSTNRRPSYYRQRQNRPYGLLGATMPQMHSVYGTGLNMTDGRGRPANYGNGGFSVSDGRARPATYEIEHLSNVYAFHGEQPGVNRDDLGTGTPRYYLMPGNPPRSNVNQRDLALLRMRMGNWSPGGSMRIMNPLIDDGSRWVFRGGPLLHPPPNYNYFDLGVPGLNPGHPEDFQGNGSMDHSNGL